MKAFLDEDFLLTTKAAERLFHDYAEREPILDYHCHLPPAEIARDERYRSITQVWLGGDHYKWRLMRANGVPEELITGGGDDEDKFKAWAATLRRSVGNPPLPLDPPRAQALLRDRRAPRRGEREPGLPRLQ